jgi:hypothetical protein
MSPTQLAGLNLHPLSHPKTNAAMENLHPLAALRPETSQHSGGLTGTAKEH